VLVRRSEFEVDPVTSSDMKYDFHETPNPRPLEICPISNTSHTHHQYQSFFKGKSMPVNNGRNITSIINLLQQQRDIPMAAQVELRVINGDASVSR